MFAEHIDGNLAVLREFGFHFPHGEHHRDDLGIDCDVLG